MTQIPPTSIELVARWGFIPEGPHFVWHVPLGGLSDIKGGLGEVPKKYAPRITQTPLGWVVVESGPRSTPLLNQPLSKAFPEPWEAVLNAVTTTDAFSTEDYGLSHRQFSMLVQVGSAYQLPWTKVAPWGTPLPWFEGISISWLELASRGLPPEVAYSLPKRGDEGNLEEILLVENVQFVVNHLAEIKITLFQASPGYRHWSDLQAATERCQDLPFAYDLLLAAIPPQPKRGQEIVASCRVILGDAEFHLHTDMTPEQVDELRIALLSTTKDPKVKADLATRFGWWLEQELPNYHPDMELWYLGLQEEEKERHLLMWRGKQIGESVSRDTFKLGALPRPELTDDALRSWVVTMSSMIKDPSLVINQARALI